MVAQRSTPKPKFTLITHKKTQYTTISGAQVIFAERAAEMHHPRQYTLRRTRDLVADLPTLTIGKQVYYPVDALYNDVQLSPQRGQTEGEYSLEDQQQALKLALTPNMNVQRIATEMGVPQNRVKTWIANATDAERSDIRRANPRMIRPTEEDHARALELAKEGKSYPQIAEELQISVALAYRWVARDAEVPDRKKAPRSMTPQEVAQAKQMRADGKTMQEIADLLGFSQSAIWDKLPANERRPRSSYTEEDKALGRKLHTPGKPLREVCDDFKAKTGKTVTVSTLARWLK